MGISVLSAAARSPREILRLYRLPYSLAEAQDYLFRLSLNLQLLRLYQHFFPDRFTRSTARARVSEEEAYSPKEAEFIQFVDQELFPIYGDFMLYASGPDERSPAIPIRPIAPNLGDDVLEHIPDAWRLAFFLAGELCADDFAPLHPALAPPRDSPLTGRDWGSIDWQLFLDNWPAVTARLHPSVAVIPLAIEMGVQGTGNVFIDANVEMPLDGFFWTLEDMEYLRQHMVEYEAALAQMETLLAWLGQDSQHIVQVLNSMQANLQTKAPDELEHFEENNDEENDIDDID